MSRTLYFGVVSNRDHIKLRTPEGELEPRPFWEFLDEHPDGWLSSLAYGRDDVPADRPQIWDCGAWTYRDEAEPALNGERVTAEYALWRYGLVAAPGAFAVAPDHMLIPATKRGPLSVYDLDERRAFNREQARAFLTPARERGLRPMGVVHGQSLHERVEHAAFLLDLGYDALAVGGVAARANSYRRAVEVVHAVREETEGVHLHVLGLSAPTYYAAWCALGVDSCDGASHFKQAFTGGKFFSLGRRGLREHRAARVRDGVRIDPLPEAWCECRACARLREDGVDTRTYGSNEHNMGRAAHNLNMLIAAHRQIAGHDGRRARRTVHLQTTLNL